MNKRITPMIDDPAEPGYVRDLIEAGRQDAVADYDYEKGLASLVAGIEAGAPMPDWAQGLDAASRTATTGAQAAMGGAAAVSGSAVGWIVGSVVAVGLATAAIFGGGAEQPAAIELAQPEPVPAVRSHEAAPPAAPRQPQAVAPELEGTQDAVDAPERTAPRSVKRAARPAQAEGSSVAKRMADKPAAAPSRDLDALMREKVGHKASAAPTRSVTAREETAAVEQEQAAPSEEPARVEAAKPQYDDARLEREMRMLKVAESLLRSNPLRALRMARQGEKEFSGSMFTQERQQVLLLALVQLGRMDEARRLAKPYLREYPRGPFSDRVRRALATGSIDGR